MAHGADRLRKQSSVRHMKRGGFAPWTRCFPSVAGTGQNGYTEIRIHKDTLAAESGPRIMGLLFFSWKDLSGDKVIKSPMKNKYNKSDP